MTEYTTIRVPKPLHDQLKKHAQELHLSLHEFISMLLTNYEEKLKELLEVRHKTLATRLELASWYITKFMLAFYGWRSLIDNNINDEALIKQKLQQLKKVCEQLESRYGISTEDFRNVVKQYLESHDKEDMILVTQLAKEIIKQIIIKILGYQVEG